jgi:hypothetical protein
MIIAIGGDPPWSGDTSVRGQPADFGFISAFPGSLLGDPAVAWGMELNFWEGDRHGDVV